MIFKKKVEAVEHVKGCFDPEEEWKSGFTGWLTRYRGMLTAGALDLILAFPAFFFAHWTVGILIVGVGFFGILHLFVLRNISKKGFRVDDKLHNFSHNLRDDIAAIVEADTSELSIRRWHEFHSTAVGCIAAFFRERTNDTTLNCAIRIARTGSDGRKFYWTVKRSEGLHASREDNSEEIPVDRGLPAALLQVDKRGVYLIDRIDKAIELGIWMPTNNDKLNDIKKVMAVPVIGWEGADKRALIGILYIVSSRIPFHRKDVDAARAVADLLGFAYTVIAESRNLAVAAVQSEKKSV